MELEDLLSCAELQFCTNSEKEVRYEPSGELQAATTSNPPRLQPAPVLPTRDPTQNSSTPPPPEPLSANQPNPHKRFVPPASANQPHPHKRFAPPVTNEEIQRRRSDSIPLSTAADTKYCTRVWLEWSDYHAKTHNSEVPPLTSISPSQFCYWLIRFVLEVRKKDGAEYPPQTLHHLCSGLLRHLRQNGHPTLDIFKDSSFAEFRSTLDAEMKRLQHKGLGSMRRQAEPLTEKEEEVLWEKGLLGDHSPQALLNTMVYMNGVYFALRSGKEHRELRFNSSQISLIERDGERPFLQYTEDESKNRPGGLKGCRIGRKVVKHHANISNPPRCFVRLYSLYKSRCPSTPKRNSFYLQCLKKPTDTPTNPLDITHSLKLFRLCVERQGLQAFVQITLCEQKVQLVSMPLEQKSS